MRVTVRRVYIHLTLRLIAAMKVIIRMATFLTMTGAEENEIKYIYSFARQSESAILFGAVDINIEC